MSAALKHAGTLKQEREEIFLTRRPALLKWATMLTGNRWDAEDLVQDLYVQWMLVRQPQIENVDGYLRRMLIYMNRARLKKMPCTVGLSKALLSRDNPEKFLDQIEARKLATRIYQFVLHRRSPSAKIIRLRFFHARSISEIAIELGYTRGLVKEWMNAGRKELVSKFKESPRPDRAPSPAVEQRSLAQTLISRKGKVRE